MLKKVRRGRIPLTGPQEQKGTPTGSGEEVSEVTPKSGQNKAWGIPETEGPGLAGVGVTALGQWPTRLLGTDPA